MANTGKWFDMKAGKVVSSQPEEGIQLVSPDVAEATPDEQARVDAFSGKSDTSDATVKSTTKK